MTKHWLTMIVIWLVCSDPAWSMSLQEALARTLSSHPRLQAADADLAAKGQRIRMEAGARLPSVDVNGHVGLEYATTSQLDTQARRKQFPQSREEVVVTQHLYDGGSTDQQVAEATARQQAAALRTRDMEETLALEVVEAYLATVRRQHLLNIQEENMALHRKVLEKLRTRSDVGMTDVSDADQVENRLALLVATAEADRGEWRNGKHRLLALVGESVEDAEKPDFNEIPLPDSEEGLLQLAIRQRLLLQALQTDTAAMEAEYKAAKARMGPAMDLEMSVGHAEGLGGVDTFNQSAKALVKARYNLYRGGSDEARLREIRDRITQSRELYLETVRSLEESVRTDWNNIKTTRMRLPHLQRHVQACMRVAAAYREQFTVGKRSLMETLHAEVELFNARANLTSEEVNLSLHLLRLYARMGMLVATLLDTERQQRVPGLPTPSPAALTPAIFPVARGPDNPHRFLQLDRNCPCLPEETTPLPLFSQITKGNW